MLRIDANVPVAKGKVVDGPHGKVARAAVDKWAAAAELAVIELVLFMELFLELLIQ